MPNHIKILISLAVLLVAGIMIYFERSRGEETLQWVIGGLALLMVLGMWAFPEAKGRKGKED